MPDQYYAGGAKAISVAPWTPSFDDTTATFVSLDMEDCIEQGLQLPSEEEATQKMGDGSDGQAGAMATIAVPVRNHGSLFLAEFTANGSRHVFRIEQLDGTAYLFGEDRGVLCRKVDKRGQTFGNFPHVLVIGMHTAATTGGVFSVPS